MQTQSTLPADLKKFCAGRFSEETFGGGACSRTRMSLAEELLATVDNRSLLPPETLEAVAAKP